MEWQCVKFQWCPETEFSNLNICIDDPSVLLVDGSDFPYLWYFNHDILANYVSFMHIVMLFSEYNFPSTGILGRIF